LFSTIIQHGNVRLIVFGTRARAILAPQNKNKSIFSHFGNNHAR
jgi:hypothetical protein